MIDLNESFREAANGHLWGTPLLFFIGRCLKCGHSASLEDARAKSIPPCPHEGPSSGT